MDKSGVKYHFWGNEGLVEEVKNLIIRVNFLGSQVINYQFSSSAEDKKSATSLVSVSKHITFSHSCFAHASVHRRPLSTQGHLPWTQFLEHV